MDGGSTLRGRVEAIASAVGSSWTMLCDDDFGPEDAPVVCRSLGLTGGTRVLPGFDTFRLNSAGPINMSLLACGGGESTVNACPYFYGDPSCRADEEVGVECGPPATGTAGQRAVQGACHMRALLQLLPAVSAEAPVCGSCRHALPCPAPGRGRLPAARTP